MKFNLITPVFNDWISLTQLCENLRATCDEKGLEPFLIAVNDGSIDPDGGIEKFAQSMKIPGVIVHLTRNVGHQKAIAIGLAYAAKHRGEFSTLVMDSDGEDMPENIPEVLSELDTSSNAPSLVVATRGKRFAGAKFGLFYNAYRLLFRLLTGRVMDFGHFSAMTPAALHRIAAMGEVWKNYAATLLVSKIPMTKLKLDRGRRYDGQSKMNFTSLIIHGMSAISIFTNVVITRFFFALITLLPVIILFISYAIFAKIFGMATPGWATSLIGISLIVCLQLVTISIGGLLFLLSGDHGIYVNNQAVADSLIDSVETVPAKPV